MPKKKRSRKRSQYRKSSGRTTQKAKASGGAASAPPPAKQVDFSTEYQYVVGDLRHIAILAAAMFATLIVLALVIQ